MTPLDQTRAILKSLASTSDADLRRFVCDPKSRRDMESTAAAVRRQLDQLTPLVTDLQTLADRIEAALGEVRA